MTGSGRDSSQGFSTSGSLIRASGGLRKAEHSLAMTLATALTRGLVLGLLLKLAICSPVASMDGGGVAVTIDAPSEVAWGSDIVARARISTVQDFDAAQFDLMYDAGVLQLTDVTDGVIGDRVIPASWGFMPPGQPGTIRVIVNISGAPGVSGSGYLADMHFHVIGPPGSLSRLHPHNGVLSDKYGDEIIATWIGNAVHVSEGGRQVFLPLVQHWLKLPPK